MSGDLEAGFCASDLDPVGRNLSQDLTWRLLLASLAKANFKWPVKMMSNVFNIGTEGVFRLPVIFCTFIKRFDILPAKDFHSSRYKTMIKGSQS